MQRETPGEDDGRQATGDKRPLERIDILEGLDRQQGGQMMQRDTHLEYQIIRPGFDRLRQASLFVRRRVDQTVEGPQPATEMHRQRRRGRHLGDGAQMPIQTSDELTHRHRFIAMPVQVLLERCVRLPVLIVERLAAEDRFRNRQEETAHAPEHARQGAQQPCLAQVAGRPLRSVAVNIEVLIDVGQRRVEHAPVVRQLPDVNQVQQVRHIQVDARATDTIDALFHVRIERDITEDVLHHQTRQQQHQVVRQG